MDYEEDYEVRWWWAWNQNELNYNYAPEEDVTVFTMGISWGQSWLNVNDWSAYDLDMRIYADDSIQIVKEHDHFKRFSDPQGVNRY